MTTLRPLNITVNESEPSVWVDSGVKVIDLLDYLANYVTPAAPSGYTLGAFPWFVYQVRLTVPRCCSLRQHCMPVAALNAASPLLK
jgi:hypothetical protein